MRRSIGVSWPMDWAKEVIESGVVMSRWEVVQERDFMVGLRVWSAAVRV
jgi:hypothetical protein